MARACPIVRFVTDFSFRDKTVVVVGGGDTAAEEALYLAKLCRRSTLFTGGTNCGPG